MRCVDGFRQVRKLSVRGKLCSRGTVASPRSMRCIMLKNPQIRRRYCRYAAKSRITRSRRRANRGARHACLAHGIVLAAPKEEELVLQDRTAEVSPEAVVVEPLILRKPIVLRSLINGIEVTVLVVDVREAVKSVRTALQHEIALAAGGMTKFR